MSAFAQSDDLRAQYAQGSFPYAEALYENGDLAEEGKVSFKYVPKQQSAPPKALTVGSKAAFLADPVSGKVYFEKNAHKKMYPASTTKILTALVTLENCDIHDKVTVSAKAAALVNEGYSNAFLQAGEEHSVYTLLQALLIPSANEAAVALAEHISGSVEDFAALCNQRAKELGCETLHFVNPNGLHDKNHYCSAYDLYLIAKECQKYEVFNEIVMTKSFTVPATKIYPQADRTYKNTNELLLSGEYCFSYCTGIKTGHTTPAGECLVASSYGEDMRVISVVLGGKETDEGNERFSDTKKLFEYVYDSFTFKCITDKKTPCTEIKVKHAVRDEQLLEVVILNDIYATVPDDITPQTVKSSIHLAEKIKAPLKKNEVLGTITYEVDGLKYTTNLVAANEVHKKPFWLYNSLVVLAVVLIVFALRLMSVKKHKAELKAAREERRRRMLEEDKENNLF